METSLFDYAASIQARDEALQRVAANSSDWMTVALTELAGIIHTFPPEFAAEHMRYVLIPLVGKPNSPHAWGPLTKQAMKRGLIHETGRLIAMTAVKSHGRRTMTYSAGIKAAR